jgi:hypothetical protein
VSILIGGLNDNYLEQLANKFQAGGFSLDFVHRVFIEYGVHDCRFALIDLEQKVTRRRHIKMV